jgi:hypothetical protein
MFSKSSKTRPTEETLPRKCSLTSKTPWRPARQRRRNTFRQRRAARRKCGSRLSLPDRLRGRRDETRPGSNPWTGRCEQLTKGCCGTPSQLAAGNGPTPLVPGDRYEEPSQGAHAASAAGANTGTRTLRREGTGGQRRKREDLEGDTSPWETRATHRWKRRDVATDSSVEQGLEVGRSPGGHLTLGPGNGTHGRAPRTPAPGRVRTLLLRQGRPAPHGFGTISAMWGSASADRSLVETPDRVLRLRFHFGGTRARLGLGCRTAVHPALSGSGR